MTHLTSQAVQVVSNVRWGLEDSLRILKETVDKHNMEESQNLSTLSECLIGLSRAPPALVVEQMTLIKASDEWVNKDKAYLYEGSVFVFSCRSEKNFFSPDRATVRVLQLVGRPARFVHPFSLPTLPLHLLYPNTHPVRIGLPGSVCVMSFSPSLLSFTAMRFK